MNVTTETALKAARLSEEGRVSQISDCLYRVEGDHGTYTVMVSHPVEVSGGCSCPAGDRTRPCSHLIAACAYHLVVEADGKQGRHLHVVNADPFAGLN